MLFGPFVNDAVAQLGKVGSSELTKLGEYCTSVNQEIEADIESSPLPVDLRFRTSVPLLRVKVAVERMNAHEAMESVSATPHKEYW